MKRLVSASALCSALLLLGSAVPVHASLIIEFEDSSLFGNSLLTGGDITTDITQIGAFDPITGFVNVPLNTLIVSGAPANNGTYIPLFEQENYNATTHVLTVSGTVNGCSTPSNCSNLPGLATMSDLFTIQFSTGLTANTSGGTTISLNMPSAASITSITVSPTLLADLGLSSTTPFTLLALTSSGQPVGESGNNYVLNAGSITLTTAAPEPAAWMLMGLGLVLTVCVAPRKFLNT
ncbi:MAG TPA: hypothetical protein VG273_09685 [Bryobacteraceae bacterium]|nr:hypothetical protein [Bryobacteraceae bacterium]